MFFETVEELDEFYCFVRMMVNVLPLEDAAMFNFISIFYNMFWITWLPIPLLLFDFDVILNISISAVESLFPSSLTEV